MLRLVQLAAAVASLAPLSQAFLIPSTSLAAASNPHHGLVDVFHHGDELRTNVPCPGCPITSDTIDQAIRDDPKTRKFIEVNVTLSRNEQGDSLLLNGQQAYPFTLSSEIFQGKLHANQILMSFPAGRSLVGSVDLGYAITIHHPSEKAGDAANPLDMVEVRLQIIDMDGFQIKDWPGLTVKLLETQDHHLMMQTVEVSTSTKSGSPGQCNTMMCAWKAWRQALKDRLPKHKGCGGRRPAHEISATEIEQGGRPHHGFHHKFHHDHHHHHAGLARFFRAAVIRVFIPIMIGLFIGATASVVGIIVGHMAIFVWRVLFRRGQRSSYTRVEAETVDDDDDEEDDETKSFIPNQEAPPVYEEAPVYAEKPSE
jgi:hypothetical protein